MPSRVGLRCCNIGGRGSDALVPQSAAGAPPIAGKRLFRIEMDVLATEFSPIGSCGRIGSQATGSVFVGGGGALRPARVAALSEGDWGRYGNQKMQKGGRSKQLHEIVFNAARSPGARMTSTSDNRRKFFKVARCLGQRTASFPTVESGEHSKWRL